MSPAAKLLEFVEDLVLDLCCEDLSLISAAVLRCSTDDEMMSGRKETLDSHR